MKKCYSPIKIMCIVSPSIRAMEEPLKYNELIAIGSTYIILGISDCNIDNAIINMERPVPCIILDAMRNDIFIILNPAAVFP